MIEHVLALAVRFQIAGHHAEAGAVALDGDVERAASRSCGATQPEFLQRRQEGVRHEGIVGLVAGREGFGEKAQASQSAAPISFNPGIARTVSVGESGVGPGACFMVRV